MTSLSRPLPISRPFSLTRRRIFLFSAAILSLLFAFTALYLHTNYYLPFIADDALISLRYVQRMLAGDGLTWTDGIRVEGYSNLLWVLLVAVGGLLGQDLIDATRFLGYLCLGITFVTILTRYTARYAWGGLVIGTLGVLYLAALGPVAVWTIGGLEQPLVILFLFSSFLLAFRLLENEEAGAGTRLLLSLCLGLLCITRPDGPLFTVVFCAVLLLVVKRYRSRLTPILQIVAFPILLAGGQLLFRLTYYGEWVPNPALVKISPSWLHMMGASTYVRDGLLAILPLTILGIVSIVLLLFVPGKRGHALLLGATFIAWSSYVIYVGGDIFPAWRHTIPLIIVLSLAVSECAIYLWLSNTKAPRRGLLVSLLLITLAFLAYSQFHNEKNLRAKQERWEWDGKVIGTFLKHAFSTQAPLLAVDASGSLPYWSDLPAIDMYGLNDYHIARNHPEDFGSGWVAHELGDGDYVFSRQPDLISFCLPLGSYTPCSPSGRRLMEIPTFRQLYQPVLFRGNMPYEATAILWAHKYSKKIGIQQQENEMVIPAFFFSETEKTVAYLNSEQALVIAVAQDAPAVLTLPNIPYEAWRVEVITPNGEQVTDQVTAQVEVAPPGVYQLTLVSTNPTPVEVSYVRILKES